MCKRRITVFGLLVLIFLLTSLPAYANLRQVTVTCRQGQPNCPTTPPLQPNCAPENTFVRNNALGETPKTISPDGTVISFLSNCNITGGNGDRNTELFLWQDDGTPTGRFIQVTNTRGVFDDTGEDNQVNPDMTVVTGPTRARIAFMSNRDTSPGPTCTTQTICPCPSCPGNSDLNTEIFRAEVNLTTSAISFAQATNTNRTGTSCQDNMNNCAFRETPTRANGWPTIDTSGDRIAFHSCCPTTELSPCQLVGGGSCGNMDGNLQVFEWRSGVATPYTQITQARANCPRPGRTGPCANFAISLTSPPPDNLSRLGFYGDCNVLGTDSDCNNEIFLWTGGSAPTFGQVSQITNTPNTCDNRLPAINSGGFLISFTSNCPSSSVAPCPAGTLCPCVLCDLSATCDNVDGNSEVFLWDSRVPQIPFTQITKTTAGGRTDPNNWRTSVAIGPTIDANPRTNIAFWSDVPTPTPGKTSDCRDPFTGGNCNNPNNNWQLFVWVDTTTPPIMGVPAFYQLSPNQGGNPPLCNSLQPQAVSLNSNDATRAVFSYNCNPLGTNADGNYEIFLDPPPPGAGPRHR